jgi:hypothetical protein
VVVHVGEVVVMNLFFVDDLSRLRAGAIPVIGMFEGVGCIIDGIF